MNFARCFPPALAGFLSLPTSAQSVESKSPEGV